MRVKQNTRFGVWVPKALCYDMYESSSRGGTVLGDHISTHLKTMHFALFANVVVCFTIGKRSEPSSGWKSLCFKYRNSYIYISISAIHSYTRD